MAQKSVLPQIGQGAARLRTLLVLLPLLAVEVAVISGNDGLGYAAGMLAWFGLSLVSTTLVLGLATALGGHAIWLDVGIGPRLDRRVSGDKVRTVRALPIGLGGAFLFDGADAGRRTRATNASALLLPAVLAAVAAPLLPGPAAAGLGSITVAFLALTATSRDPRTGRTLAARTFRAPTAHTDPELAGPFVAAPVYVRAQFGRLDEAQALLDRLRVIPGTERQAADLEAEILASRGEYDAALRIAVPKPDPADAPALTAARAATHSARAAKLLMLLVEQDPSLAARAVPLTQRHLAAVAGARTGAVTDRVGRVLFALHAGDLQIAARENNICAARARMPREIADALCNRALIRARLGRPAEAAKALDQAERFAPWYPRIATVRGICAAGAGALLATVPPQPSAPDTSRLFAEPWSAPRD
jgi:hypothetical protein